MLLGGHLALDPSGDTGSLKAIRGPLQAAEPAWCRAVHPGNRVSFFPLKNKQEIYIYIYFFMYSCARTSLYGHSLWIPATFSSCGSRPVLGPGRGGLAGAGAGLAQSSWPGPRNRACGPALGQRPYPLLLGTKNLREGAAGDAGPLAWGRHNPPPCRQSSPHFCHLPQGGLPGPQPWPTTVTSPPLPTPCPEGSLGPPHPEMIRMI